MHDVIKKSRNPESVPALPAGGILPPEIPRAGRPRKGPKRIAFTTVVLALLLLLAPALSLSAQQSFFISPGQTIRNGDIVRGYCPERTQAPLTTENIENLTNLIGNVVITYNDNSEVEKSFAEFYRDCSLSFTGFNSASLIRMSFDPSIKHITVGGDGMIMARKDADVEFIKNNANTIMAARRVGASAWEAQNTSWQSEWKPVPVLDEERNVIVFDNRGYTRTKAGEKAFMEFAGGAEVNQRYHNGRYNSFDTLKFALTDFEYLDSSRQPVEFISMEWLKTQFLRFLTGKQGKAS
jgi:hypothetical protein